MTGTKRDKIAARYIDLTTRRRGRKSHAEAIAILQSIFCESRSDIEEVVKNHECYALGKPKSEIQKEEKPVETKPEPIPKYAKAPEEVLTVLADALTDLTAQHDAYFRTFNRVDDTLKDLEQKIDIIGSYMALVK